MSLPRLAIIGASRLGQMIAHYAVETGQFEVAGFFDNAVAKGTVTKGGTVLGKTDDLRAHHAGGAFDALLIGVGYENWHWRVKFFEDHADLHIPTLVHPTSYINASAQLGRGVVILPGCIVDMFCVLEDNAFLNPGVILAHDTSVGAHSFIAPGVKVSGFSRVGRRCFVGIGAAIGNDVITCDDTTIGAGTVVVESLPTPGTYVGAPARLVATREPA
jgi:sugar O-acyltransferase (sialic acid O-acetyltransferase NeuD family)